VTEGLFYFYSHNIALWRILRGETYEHLFAHTEGGDISKEYPRIGHIDLTVLHPCGII
jgi:hypothetical protein